MKVGNAFIVDAYRDWPVDRIKDRCRELACATFDWQLIALQMSGVPGALDKLDKSAREKVERLRAAYSD